jgi:hypothetical protein
MVFNSKFLKIFIINFLAVTKNDDRPFEKKFLAFSTSQVHPQMKSNGNCLERRKNGDFKWLLLKL